MSLFRLDEALAVLERTPATLQAWLEGLPEPWTTATEGPNTWSPVIVLAHLVDGEMTDWMTRTRIILAGGAEPRFAPFNRQGHEEAGRGKSLGDLLAEFRDRRGANVAELRSLGLTSEQLRLTGIHPEFGRVTLQELLATWVAHDLDHLMQVARVMARRYSDEVGPWRRYLRVIGAPVEPFS